MTTKTDNEKPKVTQFPSAPAAIAEFYLSLGGDLSRFSEGTCVTGCPEPIALNDIVPESPLLEPWENPLNFDQWKGAMRILRALISRLNVDESDFVFSTFAYQLAYPWAQRQGEGQ